MLLSLKKRKGVLKVNQGKKDLMAGELAEKRGKIKPLPSLL
jgi:hypothetical protein